MPLPVITADRNRPDRPAGPARGDAWHLAAWSHRQGLDGLRAIAVTLVVAFHSRLSWASGGFVGVDVFFVLSGFLVTTILLNEHHGSGRIGLVRFYSRRLRRLAPAALLVIVSTAVLMVAVRPRLTRLELGGDAASAAVWVANWRFVRQSSDYFAASVEESPYLHFWSLAIEEQFYLAFPLLLIGLLGIARRLSRPAIVAVVIAALAAASLMLQFTISGSGTRAYYGTDTRVYQLLAGALLAIGLVRLRMTRRRLPAVLQATGAPIAALALLGLVITSTAFDTWTPGVRGLVVVGLTFALLWGLEAAPAALPSRTLAAAPLAALGRISYAVYLWHWPLMVAARERWPDVKPITVFFGAGVASILLAALSTHLLEGPIRRTTTGRAPQWIGAGLVCSLLVALLAPPLTRLDVDPILAPAAGSSAVQDPQVTNTQQTADDGAFSGVEPGTALGALAESGATPGIADALVPIDDALLFARTKPHPLPECPPTPQSRCGDSDGNADDPSAQPRVLLIGDSHGLSLVPALRALGAQHGYQLVSRVGLGCPWQLDLLDPDWADDCRVHQASVDRETQQLMPDMVVVAGIGRLVDAENRLTGNGDLADLAGEPLVLEATKRAVERLVALGLPVIIIEPIPLPLYDPNVCLATAEAAFDCAFVASVQSAEADIYRSVASGYESVASVDLSAVTCPTSPACRVSNFGTPLYRDQFHFDHDRWNERRGELWAAIGPSVSDGLGLAG